MSLYAKEETFLSSLMLSAICVHFYSTCRSLCNICIHLINTIAKILMPRYQYTKCHEVTIIVKLLIISVTQHTLQDRVNDTILRM